MVGRRAPQLFSTHLNSGKGRSSEGSEGHFLEQCPPVKGPTFLRACAYVVEPHANQGFRVQVQLSDFQLPFQTHVEHMFCGYPNRYWAIVMPIHGVRVVATLLDRQ